MIVLGNRTRDTAHIHVLEMEATDFVYPMQPRSQALPWEKPRHKKRRFPVKTAPKSKVKRLQVKTAIACLENYYTNKIIITRVHTIDLMPNYKINSRLANLDCKY
jgi:hypothetical protein